MFALTEGINILYNQVKEPSFQPCKKKKKWFTSDLNVNSSITASIKNKSHVNKSLVKRLIPLFFSCGIVFILQGSLNQEGPAVEQGRWKPLCSVTLDQSVHAPTLQNMCFGMDSIPLKLQTKFWLGIYLNRDLISSLEYDWVHFIYGLLIFQYYIKKNTWVVWQF